MLIIGMTGPISHGKSTFASALAEIEPKTIHLEFSSVVDMIADAMHMALDKIPDPYDVNQLNNWLKSLPAILLEAVHTKTTFDQLRLDEASIKEHPVEYQKLILHVENLRKHPKLSRQSITVDNKETYRPFLQWLGAYLVQKVDSGIWQKEIVRLIYDASTTGTKICIVGGLRFPSDATAIRSAGGIIVKVYRPGHLQADMLDPTERERDNIPVDCTIMSNGTVEDLRLCSRHVLNDIQANSLRTLYQTSVDKN